MSSKSVLFKNTISSVIQSIFVIFFANFFYFFYLKNTTIEVPYTPLPNINMESIFSGFDLEVV
jgi:hypothetical protein